MINGLLTMYRQYGVVHGLWRGATGAMVRIGVASSAQLSTMSLMNEALVKHGVLTKDEKLLSTLISSMLGGVLMAMLMAPFDLVSTRLYNQGITNDSCRIAVVCKFPCWLSFITFLFSTIQLKYKINSILTPFFLFLVVVNQILTPL